MRYLFMYTCSAHCYYYSLNGNKEQIKVTHENDFTFNTTCKQRGLILTLYLQNENVLEVKLPNTKYFC